MIKYDIICSINLAESVQEIDEFEKTLNSVMSNYGVNEQFKIGADICIMQLSVNRNLKQKEKDTIKEMLQTQLNSNSVLSKLVVKQISKSSNKSQSR